MTFDVAASGQKITFDPALNGATIGPISDHVSITVSTSSQAVQLANSDQRGNSRPRGGLGDIGAIEK